MLTANRPKVDGQEIEKQRALGFRRKRDELAPGVRLHLAVDVFEVCRLAAESGAVIDDFAVDLARGVVDHRHGCFSLSEQFVDFVFSTGEQARRLRGAIGAAREHQFKKFCEFVHRFLHFQAHEAERRAVIEKGH